MLITTALAKVMSAGVLAKTTAGAALAVTAVTGAGAAGVLPDPVQDPVAAVVEGVSPLDLPDSGDVLAEAVEPAPEQPADEPATGEDPVAADPVAEDPVAEEEAPADPAAFDATAWAAAGPEGYASFGAWVSEGARNGAFRGEGVRFGEVVRDWAGRKHLDEADLAAEGVDLAALPVADGPAQPVAEVAEVPAQAPTAAATRGSDRPKATGGATTRGNGNGGNGNGNGRGGGRG